MQYLVKEYWCSGKVGEFGPFTDYESAFQFKENCQMPDAKEFIETVTIEEWSEEEGE